MAEAAVGTLLTAGDVPPVAVYNPAGRSAFLLVGDHAGAAVPRRLAKLGLSDADLGRHIALDIGVEALGRRMADLLDAVFVHQRYSRLVIDCNRAPDRPDAVPAESDGTAIPGNIGLPASERLSRVEAIHAPYQRAIADELDRRAAIGEGAILISLHSFTPVLGERERPWNVGILYDGGETRLARRMLELLSGEPELRLGDNEPYRMDDTDHTVPRHAYGRQLAYVEIEVRQDCLGDGGLFESLAHALSDGLRRAARDIGEGGGFS